MMQCCQVFLDKQVPMFIATNQVSDDVYYIICFHKVDYGSFWLFAMFHHWRRHTSESSIIHSVDHYSNVTWASQIIDNFTVFNGCSGLQKRKHQSFTILGLCEGGPRWPRDPSQRANNAEKSIPIRLNKYWFFLQNAMYTWNNIKCQGFRPELMLWSNQHPWPRHICKFEIMVTRQVVRISDVLIIIPNNLFLASRHTRADKSWRNTARYFLERKPMFITTMVSMSVVDITSYVAEIDDVRTDKWRSNNFMLWDSIIYLKCNEPQLPVKIWPQKNGAMHLFSSIKVPS